MSKKNKNIAEETLGGFPDLSPKQPEVRQELIDQAIANLSEKKQTQEELVQVVNARMATTQIPIKSGMGLAKVRLGPFEISPPLPRTQAEQMISSMNDRISKGKRSGRLGETQLPDVFLLAPPPPPNYKVSTFNDPVSGMAFSMDKYRPKSGTLRPDGAPLFLSEEQAFYVISKMVSAEAIQRYVREFDSRYSVIQFANRVMAYREESMLNRLGMNKTTRSTATV